MFVFFFVAEKKKYYGAYVLLIRPENYFTDENSVHHKKKQLSLKCAINDTLTGSQRQGANFNWCLHRGGI